MSHLVQLSINTYHNKVLIGLQTIYKHQLKITIE